MIGSWPIRLLAVDGRECQRKKFYERLRLASTGDDEPFGEAGLNYEPIVWVRGEVQLITELSLQ